MHVGRRGGNFSVMEHQDYITMDVINSVDCLLVLFLDLMITYHLIRNVVFVCFIL